MLKSLLSLQMYLLIEGKVASFPIPMYNNDKKKYTLQIAAIIH